MVTMAESFQSWGDRSVFQTMPDDLIQPVDVGVATMFEHFGGDEADTGVLSFLDDGLSFHGTAEVHLQALELR
jgi:hypothetical protein